MSVGTSTSIMIIADGMLRASESDVAKIDYLVETMPTEEVTFEERLRGLDPEIELPSRAASSPTLSLGADDHPALDTRPDTRQSEHNEFSLLPADGGKAAWLFLASSFFIEALVWGFPFSFGVFQDYYRNHKDFSDSPGIVAIGTTALGVMYLGMPFVMAMLRLYPRFARWSPVVGLVLMCISLAASSFSEAPWQLILTQGVLYGVGGSLGYNPCLLYMPEWFVRRRGLAYGVMWAGTGLGGVVFPLLFAWLLREYGIRTALRAWSVGLFVTVLPVAYFIKPRLPASASIHMKSYNISFVLQPTFLIFMIPTVIESMGFFLPTIHLPAYARSVLGASTFTSALTVILINLSSTVGMVVLGTLTDRLHVTTCIMISTIGAVLGTLLLWGFSVNLPILYIFCISYGFFAGSFIASWPRIMGHVVKAAQGRLNSQGRTTSMDPSMVIGMLSSARGVGNLVSGPLSEALVDGLPWKGEGIGGWGSGYGSLIAFTGVTAAVGGVSIFWRKGIV